MNKKILGILSGTVMGIGILIGYAQPEKVVGIQEVVYLAPHSSATLGYYTGLVSNYEITIGKDKFQILDGENVIAQIENPTYEKMDLSELPEEAQLEGLKEAKRVLPYNPAEKKGYILLEGADAEYIMGYITASQEMLLTDSIWKVE